MKDFDLLSEYAMKGKWASFLKQLRYVSVPTPIAVAIYEHIYLEMLHSHDFDVASHILYKTSLLLEIYISFSV